MIFRIDAKYKEFQELPGQIKQLRSELEGLELKVHEKEERLKSLVINVFFFSLNRKKLCDFLLIYLFFPSPF